MDFTLNESGQLHVQLAAKPGQVVRFFRHGGRLKTYHGTVLKIELNVFLGKEGIVSPDYVGKPIVRATYTVNAGKRDGYSTKDRIWHISESQILRDGEPGRATQIADMMRAESKALRGPHVAQPDLRTTAEWRRSLPLGSVFHLVRTEPIRPNGFYSTDMMLTQICNGKPQRGRGGFEVLTAKMGFKKCCDKCLASMEGPARSYYRIELLPSHLHPDKPQNDPAN